MKEVVRVTSDPFRSLDTRPGLPIAEPGHPVGPSGYPKTAFLLEKGSGNILIPKMVWHTRSLIELQVVDVQSVLKKNA